MERSLWQGILVGTENYRAEDEVGPGVGSGKRARLGVTMWVTWVQPVPWKDFTAELTSCLLQKVGLWVLICHPKNDTAKG